MKVLDEYVEECVREIERVMAVPQEYRREIRIRVIDKEISEVFEKYLASGAGASRRVEGAQKMTVIKDKYGLDAELLEQAHFAGEKDPVGLIASLDEEEQVILSTNRRFWTPLTNMKRENWKGFFELRRQMRDIIGFDGLWVLFENRYEETVEAYNRCEDTGWMESFKEDSGVVLRLFGRPNEKLLNFKNAWEVYTKTEINSIPEKIFIPLMDNIMSLDSVQREVLLEAIEGGDVRRNALNMAMFKFDEHYVDRFFMLVRRDMTPNHATHFAHQKEIAENYVQMYDVIGDAYRDQFKALFPHVRYLAGLDVGLCKEMIDVYNLGSKVATPEERLALFDGMRMAIKQGQAEQWAEYVGNELRKGTTGGGNYKMMYERKAA